MTKLMTESTCHNLILKTSFVRDCPCLSAMLVSPPRTRISISSSTPCKKPGAKARPGLDDALSLLRSGDALVVWKLDRLGRSLIDLVTIINTLKEREIHFKVLTENIDTSSPMGELYFHFTAALAQFERRRIRECKFGNYLS